MSKGDKVIPERIVVDEIDEKAVRASMQNKFVYKDEVGEFPPYSLAEFTMMLKINRLEKRILSGREEKTSGKKKKKIEIENRGFNL